MKFYEIKNQVIDQFGNIKQEFEVIVYEKLATGEWVEPCPAIIESLNKTLQWQTDTINKMK